MDGFINPYTFIPVNQGKKQDYDAYFTEPLLSGKISCTLTTRTQIAICDKVGERDFDFFKVDGKATIMGSSLRGTIRSIYEALTDSCLSSTNAEDEDYFSSRLNKEAPGLIEYVPNKGYVLYKACRYKDKSNKQLENLKTGTLVSFEGFTTRNNNYFFRNINRPENTKKGYVHKVDRFCTGQKANKDSIFQKKDNNGFLLDEEVMKRFAENIKKYEPTTSKKGEEFKRGERIIQEYKDQFEQLMMKKEKVILPVWYCYKNNRYYLAPSQMSRGIFFEKPADMLEKKNLTPCNNEKTICEACALFGIVRKSNDSSFAKASRIRFSDAVCEDKNCFFLKPQQIMLASPRLSSFEFYLKTRDFNNYQYDADDNDVSIAGRKYYWHHNDDKIKNSVTNDNQNMTYTIKTVKKNSTFIFDVYFDQIPEDALKKLLFVLTLGENSEDSDYCHKIGHGKPIGLGSVKIKVDSVKVRTFSDGLYQETDYFWNEKELRNVFANQKNVDNILKVTNFNAVDGKDIQYPTTNTTDGKIFDWFSKNRKMFEKGRPISPIKYYNKLPSLNDKNQYLPYHPQSQKGGGNWNSGSPPPSTSRNSNGNSSKHSSSNSADFNNSFHNIIKRDKEKEKQERKDRKNKKGRK